MKRRDLLLLIELQEGHFLDDAQVAQDGIALLRLFSSACSPKESLSLCKSASQGDTSLQNHIL